VCGLEQQSFRHVGMYFMKTSACPKTPLSKAAIFVPGQTATR